MGARAVTKGKSGKAATGIECDDVTDVNTTVEVETRQSPGKGHKKQSHGSDVFKPTDCGTFYLNDGVIAILVDGGVPVLSTLDGEPIILDEAPMLPVTADDSGPFTCDGELK